MTDTADQTMGGGREKDANGKETRNGDGIQKSPKNENRRKSMSKENTPVPPPDGGWGWMVVLSSFLIHIIADGIVYSFGIFYMEFLEYYKGGKGETAWVGSLVPGVTLSVGPLASILTNKYGCRVTTIAGAIIAAAGFVLSLFAPNLYFLYFSFGIMAGLGFGLIYLPAIVSVGYYFEEKRAFATGLAVCGSGLGAFIFNPFSKYLIDEFGWRGAILIEAGIILNCVLCGALFRPLEHPKASQNSDTAKKPPLDSQLVKDSLELELFVSNGTTVTSQPSSPTRDITPFSLEPPHKDTAIFRSDGALHRSTHKPMTPSPLTMDQTQGTNSSTQPHLRRLLSEEHHYHHHRHSNQHAPFRSHRNLVLGGIYQSGSLMNISLQKSHPALYIASLTSIPGEETDLKKRLCCCDVPANIYYSLKNMCDFSLLKDTIFLMFVVSNFCTSIGFNMPFIFLTDRAVDEGISPEDAKWLVSAIGISNTVGRVLFGFLADRQGVNRLMLYNTALTICGVATALCPLCYSYSLLVLYACVFGLFIGVYVSLTSVVLVDLLGLEMLTNSFGLLLMFQGIATLVGPPIAGWLYDGTGSYDVSFIVAGVIVAVSGIMLYFIPLVRRCIDKDDVEDGDASEQRELTA
ncbi:monocarboxylate transporter 5-like [Ruditapes philippinarum]|uniref:monocarboxylate transporter 5-like n=1 Tax=Ruditapes philippinarum TaxID=129788 RepID=UPI00295A7AEC|nr:monocarboxylate transporter 5-like [Ruditapes philippinarum]